MPNTLPLSLLCAITVNISAVLATAPAFNQGIYIGNSAVIPSQGVNGRCRQYNVGNWSSAMLQDGFSVTSPEYIAMGLYFGQSPAPQYGWVGVQDATAIAAANIHAGNAGTGYTLNDIVTVTQGGASLGTVKITAVNAGVPTAVSVVSGAQGTGYAIANALATTGGTGTGLQVDITAIGETLLQAVAACRLASPTWYAAAVYGAVKADHVAIAGFAQSSTPQMMYHYSTADADALSGAAGNVFTTLKTQNYTRAFGTYNTAQAGAAPNNIYAAAAHMGRAMGLNTGLAGSYFTMKFKDLAGIATEPLTVSQIGVIAGNNGNVYVNYANTYNFLQEGVVGNGQFYDEVLFLDVLAAQIQYNVVAAFAANRAIPLTDLGQQVIIAAGNQGCATLAGIGFIQAGTWTGQQVLNLKSGDPLPTGYQCASDKFANQVPGDRALRKFMPLYVNVIEGQAGHSATVGIYVQR